MLSNEDNELLCRVSRGTPMGELFRRFWLPALLSSEMVPDSPPRRLRILGEDLVAFRDTDGRVGIVGAYCPHKLAPLFFGRNEECGLRCVYHGWKFDVNGNCVDVPNVPVNADALKRKVQIPSYPTREVSGLIWVYMGPAEREPDLPGFEFTRVSPDQAYFARWLQCTNWAQGMEGEIDSSHISFLHRSFDADGLGGAGKLVRQTAPNPPGMRDGAPVMTIKQTPYGFVYGARRNTEAGDYYWRITHWFAPMFSMIPNNQFPFTGRMWVPIDDYHTNVFTFAYNAERPFTAAELSEMNAGYGFPPPMDPAAYRLPDGYIIDTNLPRANKGNDFRIDRDRQRKANFSGIGAITDQDRALQENMLSMPGVNSGLMVDRSKEMLVPSDAPVITARNILLRMVKELQNGVEPAMAREPELFFRRSAAAVAPQAEFDDFLAAHGDEMRAGI
jgi:phenylpropionate dioxygenase-like ring-hydroxylating dioxygenase large terminal subunit